MINPILFLSALGPDMIYSMVYELDKCFITWEIKKIEVEKNNDFDCLSKIIIDVDWKYKVNSIKIENNLCSIDSYSVLYKNNNFPKVWDEVNYLLESEDFSLIADEYEDWFFRLISGEILEQEINSCEVEKIKIEKDSIYIWFIWVGIFLLIIFSILLYKRI